MKIAHVHIRSVITSIGNARAEEIRTMDDAESKATMLKIAEDYKILAGRAKQRLRWRSQNSN